MDASDRKPAAFFPFLSLAAMRIPRGAHVAVLFAFLVIITVQLAVRPAPPPLPSEQPHPQPPSFSSSGPRRPTCVGFYSGGRGLPRRGVVMSITEFGGVGDGRTSNTAVFRKAVERMRGLAGEGGSQLNVPRGTWLTGSFNLTSNFTLFLEEGAVILGSQDMEEWPVIEPLPSYGRGRERLGGRHVSLIHGDGLADVVITGRGSFF